MADGQTVLVDGGDGRVIVDADAESIHRELFHDEVRLAASRSVHGPGRTADGHPVQLLVNIGGDRDLTAAAAADSEGVGLFRTEFLFLDRRPAIRCSRSSSSASAWPACRWRR